MATESPIRILEETDKWARHKQSSSYGSSSSTKLALGGFSSFLTGQKFQNLEKDVIPSRSGSAPPNMEGSFAAIESIFSPQKYDLDSDVNLNNKSFNLPEKSRACHRSCIAGNDWKFNPHIDSADDSLRMHRNILPSHEEESEDDRSSEQSASVDKYLDFHNGSLDSTVEGSRHTSSPSPVLSSDKPDGHISESNLQMLCDLSINESLDGTSSLDKMAEASQFPLTGPISYLDDAKVATISSHAHVQNFGTVNVNGDLSNTGVGTHIDVGSGVNLPNAVSSDVELVEKDPLVYQNLLFPQQLVQSSYPQMFYSGISQVYGGSNPFQFASSSVSTGGTQQILQASDFTPHFYSPIPSFVGPQNPCYPNIHPAGFFTPQYGIGGYTFNSAMFPSYMSGYPHQSPFPMTFDNFATSLVSDGRNVSPHDMQNSQKFYGQGGIPMQSPSTDPYQSQYFQAQILNPYSKNAQFDHQVKDSGLNPVNARELKKGQDLTSYSNNPKSQYTAGGVYNNLNLGLGNASNHYPFESSASVAPLVQFHPPPIVNPVVPAKPMKGVNFSGGISNATHPRSFYVDSGRTYGLQNQIWNEMNSSSFLEELKSGKGQRFELSDIVGHIGEFSVDQHGSRFIQQKLEHCSTEEKASVFEEVIPLATKLMTDVFGNYVIQKLFEYGSLEQKRDLADQLEHQILPLSLQMYGCRVIQKALEVITLEQKLKLARELEGHVMRCVRDQNGNHVIQKCIESIPADHIHFIISSFSGHVATLSMHPYGCRVIQRVLEHCNDDVQTQFIIDEILDSVCSLAQDQYGNYVTQHVLERGITRERSVIIEKLSGSIVQLSQHKFASNVIEKCLEFGDSSARDLLIKEIIGHGDKDDNMLVMMKDQYANYVMQKILKNCTSDQRETLFGLIRNHLSALKKYTYGKHIVARFEQLYGEEIQPSGS